jgi:serine/threonine-protein kinase
VERGDLTGAILDARYRVIEPVAQGAMGTVYRAERIKLGRIVAIKVLHDVLPHELSGRKRFEIEAMAMAKLEHPHCASVLDVGVYSDRPYVVMDFVSGQNLKDLIATGPQPIGRATEILRQVLSGLAHAHELGIIHRDIKPANLVLSQKTGLGDHVKILDFGLARLHDAGQNLTTGIVVGTPAYMAPEQIRGHQLDGRADLYACGVLLFELLTGQKPFHSEADDPIEVCRMHLKAPIPRLEDKLPGGGFGELEAVVAKALAKDARDRYASAQEFAAALEADAVRRPSRPSVPPLPPSGPIELGSRDMMAAEASAIEVRTADVIASIPDSSFDPDASARGAPAAGPAARMATPPVGLAPRTATPAAGTAARTATPAAGARAATPAAGARAATPAAGARAAPSAELEGDVSAPGTFFGLAVRAPTPVPREAEPSARVPRRAMRWRRPVVIVGAIGAGAAIALRGGPAEPTAAAPSAAAPATPDPIRDLVARANDLANQREPEAALDVLRRARRQYPDSAVLAYTAGQICFSRYYWTEGLKHFRDAIRLDASYRSDPELIKTVLRGFNTTPSYNNDLAGFLHDDIGSAAAPFLEETARDHRNPVIRSRAAGELRRYPGH